MPMRRVEAFKGFTRVRFFSGRLLSADDLAAEQEYLREKRKLHNRFLCGSGVVSGLEVKVGTAAITVSPGLALDPRGNEVVVDCPVEVALPKGKSGFLSLAYREEETDPVPAGDGMQASRIKEVYVLSVEPTPSPEAVHIAQLIRRSGRWRINRRFRPRRVSPRRVT
jgi:hypothetical protein